MRWINVLRRRFTSGETDVCVPEGDPGAVKDAERVRLELRRQTDERREIDAVIAEMQARVLNEQRRAE